MAKVELSPQVLIPARPILIVGAVVDGKPNFMEVGGGGSISADPPLIALPIRHQRHTLKGILDKRTLSVNMPSVDQAKEADYTGIVSGADRDKARDCGFDVFYGKLDTAPMITQCPVNLECTLVHIISSTSHMIVIARVDATHISSEYYKDGKVNLDRLDPLLWIASRADYVGIGKSVGKSGTIGKEIKGR
jgi:flavin reductase (DIM6/NTAB) family NADH-FMN oxidoreductase RutF